MTCANAPALIALTIFEIGLAAVCLALIGALFMAVVRHRE